MTDKIGHWEAQVLGGLGPDPTDTILYNEDDVAWVNERRIVEKAVSWYRACEKAEEGDDDSIDAASEAADELVQAVEDYLS